MGHLEDDLSAYLAGELNPQERMAAEEHLTECRECREQMETLQQLDAVLSQAGSIEPGPGFVAGVLNRIEQDHKVIAFRSRRALAWIAMVAVAAFFAFLIGLKQIHRPGEIVFHHPKPKQERIAKPVAPPVESPTAAPLQSSTAQPQPLSAEDTELIADLDVLEDLDVIENYDSVENLDVALLDSPAESVQ